MEYKSSKDQMNIYDCNGIGSRIKMVGEPKRFECGFELRNVTSRDTGTWKCIMEEYKFGNQKGVKDYGEVNLKVQGIPKGMSEISLNHKTPILNHSLSIISRFPSVPTRFDFFDHYRSVDF